MAPSTNNFDAVAHRGSDAIAGGRNEAERAIGACRPRLAIVVVPIKGKAAHFEAWLEGGVLLISASRQPFVDAARVLIALGSDPNAVLVMRHAGSDAIALKAKLGVAAGLAVEEGPHGAWFVPHRMGAKTRVAASPIAPTPPAATTPRDADAPLGKPPTPLFHKEKACPAAGNSEDACIDQVGGGAASRLTGPEIKRLQGAARFMKLFRVKRVDDAVDPELRDQKEGTGPADDQVGAHHVP
jgi:hypothetical protein